MTKKHKLSARGRRRASERAAVKLAEDRVRLAELEPGGRPERPIAVETVAVVEVRARSTRCAVCEAELLLEEHEIFEHAGGRLRRVRLVCKQCHTPRIIFFRIAPPLAN